jgi:hypothetical protein
MPTVGSAAPSAPRPFLAPRTRAPALSARALAWIVLAAVLVLALALRLWGVKQGLPYAYNSDEADHFVPRAVSMFGSSLNPHYFENPPAFTYLRSPTAAPRGCGGRSRCTPPTSTRSRA